MKNKLTEELAVCGVNAVKALEKTGAEKISRLYYTAEKSRVFGPLCKALAARRVPYNCVAPEDLQKLCGSVHHQGVVAMIRFPHISQVDQDYLDEWAARKEKVLVLDNVGNANNFGAIIRSAAFFGWKHVIISPEDQAGLALTTSAYRIAEGGMEYVEICAVRSLPEMLRAAEGVILRIGASAHGTVPARTLGGAAKAKALFLVLGNEERGLTPGVAKNCDLLVRIGPQGRPRIESLNVAQAASVLLYECSGNED